MVTRLLCWVALCLLGSGDADTGVSQSPKYRITVRGQNVTLWCDPISGHAVLYWYRQTLGQSPEYLLYFQNNFMSDNSGLPSDRFSAERAGGSSSTLRIQPAEAGDSALYLCASSLATVGHCPLLPAHKPSCAQLSPQFSEALAKELPWSCRIKGQKRIWDFKCSSDKRSENK
ncbi:T-cell receptor beta chain V region CTL-L17 [Tupaia chinensis]|nr:T-cell receptor beta chain V region CTL-L17 [Tupaia chinensis]